MQRRYEVFVLIISQLNGNSRDGSVGIALGYGLDDRGSRVRFPAGAGNFSLHYRIQNVSLGPTQQPIQWVPGVLSLDVKRPGREVDHSPPSGAEAKNACGAIPPLPNTSSWRGA
jgi:hypothetical protein